MAMSLADTLEAINLRNLAPFGENSFIGSKAHSSALLAASVALNRPLAVHPLCHQPDDRLGGSTKLGRACTIDPRYVPRHLDDGHLHSKANAEIGYLFHACIARGFDFAFRPAFAKAARNYNPVNIFQMRARVALFENLGIEPVDIDAHALANPSMGKRLDERFVSILEICVFAHNGDRNVAVWMCDAAGNLPPDIESQTGR